MNSLTHQDIKFNTSNQNWAVRTASRLYRAWQNMLELDAEIAQIHEKAYDSFMAKYAPQPTITQEDYDETINDFLAGTGRI